MTNTIRFAGAVIAAGLVSSLTDWFFFGVLFHEKNQVYPEVWRPEIQAGKESKAVFLSALLGFVTASAFLGLAQWLGATSLITALKLALLIWLIAPLPITTTNFLFIKLHPSLLISNNLGWLAKLNVCAAAAAIFLK